MHGMMWKQSLNTKINGNPSRARDLASPRLPLLTFSLAVRSVLGADLVMMRDDDDE